MEPSALELVLAGYAGGSLSPALHALVGAHLELSPANRAFVRSLEESLGREAVAAKPCSIRNREARLDAIFGSAPMETPAVAPRLDEPRALRHFVGKAIDDLEFRTILPGVRECRIPVEDDTTAMFYRIRPGRKMPQHSHEGSEITLVLRGGFSDASGHFSRGDIAVADEHFDHVPVADEGEECLCFAVLDAPLRLTGMFGRWVNPALRLFDKRPGKPDRSGH